MRRFDFANLQILGTVAAFGLMTGIVAISSVAVAQTALTPPVVDTEKSEDRAPPETPASETRGSETSASETSASETSDSAPAAERPASAGEEAAVPVGRADPAVATGAPVAPAGAGEPTASSAPAPAPQQAEAAPNAVPDPATAKKTDTDGRTIVRLNPLQTARPDRNIVVCEAGCGGTRVVYDGANGGPVSEAASAVAPQVNASCRGGCYASPPGHTWAGYDQSRGVTVSVTAPRLLDGEGQWMTSGTPSSSAAPGISIKPGIMAAPAATPQTKPAKVKRDDWMARINREREVDKAAKPASASE
ncbi:MAG: hypothetical protein SH859_07290 [Hyphomicrobium aestuarii]|nr:hypothetical protein [Hyphomicrobium aestuarii]